MAKKQRSPNHPSSDLSDAVRRALLLYKAEKLHAVPVELAAKHIGYRGVSGPSRQALSSMKQFGLVRIQDGTVEVDKKTQALSLRGAESAEGKAILKEAALTPPLFKGLWERVHQSDEALIYDLVANQGFGEDGARRAVRAFRETVIYAGLEADDDDDGSSEPATPEAGDSEAPADVANPGRAKQTADDYLLSVPLEPGVAATVRFPRWPTPRDIRKVIQYLKLEQDEVAEQAD